MNGPTPDQWTFEGTYDNLFRRPDLPQLQLAHAGIEDYGLDAAYVQHYPLPHEDEWEYKAEDIPQEWLQQTWSQQSCIDNVLEVFPDASRKHVSALYTNLSRSLVDEALCQASTFPWLDFMPPLAFCNTEGRY